MCAPTKVHLSKELHDVNFADEHFMFPCYHAIPKSERFIDKSEAKSVKWPNDYWIHETGAWIRVHKRPRRSLFVPFGTPDGPDVTSLNGKRLTKISYVESDSKQKGSEVYCDRWLSYGDHQLQRRLMERKWTGCTVFPINPSAGTARVKLRKRNHNGTGKPKDFWMDHTPTDLDELLGPASGDYYSDDGSSNQKSVPPEEELSHHTQNHYRANIQSQIGIAARYATREDADLTLEDKIIEFRTRLALQPNLIESVQSDDVERSVAFIGSKPLLQTSSTHRDAYLSHGVQGQREQPRAYKPTSPDRAGGRTTQCSDTRAKDDRRGKRDHRSDQGTAGQVKLAEKQFLGAFSRRRKYLFAMVAEREVVDVVEHTA